MYQLYRTWAAAYGGECKEQFQTAQEMRNEFFIPGACNQYYYAALSAGRDSAYEDRDSDRAASGDRGSILRALKLAGRSDNLVVNLFSKPGLAIQKLTTKEPDDSMIEVAIQAVEAVFDWRAYEAENFHTAADH